MPLQTIYALGENQITVSGGGQLSGENQGDGSHLDNLTITLNSNAWEAILIDDDDANFADNDNSQRLEGSQSFGGTTYDDNLIVEAEFSITVQDSSGQQYTLYAFNINQPGSSLPSYGSVEGLAFLDNTTPGSPFPPIGEALTVIDTGEGPSTSFSSLATPPCFTPGTMIETSIGPRDVVELDPGDLVLTMDHGPQPIRWVGTTTVPQAVLKREIRFRPIVMAPNSLGPGFPAKELVVSPQHRVLVSGWRAQLHFGHNEVLVPAVHLCNDQTIRRSLPDADVTYIHLLFDKHEILWSNGQPTESYFPGAQEQTAIAAELRQLFPELGMGERLYQTARPCVQGVRAVALQG